MNPTRTDAAPLCDFCGVRPATLFDVYVPIWIVAGGARSPEGRPHDLCQVCHDITFLPYQAKDESP
jgi:hypothetical protein